MVLLQQWSLEPTPVSNGLSPPYGHFLAVVPLVVYLNQEAPPPIFLLARPGANPAKFNTYSPFP